MTLSTKLALGDDNDDDGGWGIYGGLVLSRRPGSMLLLDDKGSDESRGNEDAGPDRCCRWKGSGLGVGPPTSRGFEDEDESPMGSGRRPPPPD